MQIVALQREAAKTAYSESISQNAQPILLTLAEKALGEAG
jgi:hypothetical protein